MSIFIDRILNSNFFPHIISILIFIFYLVFIRVCYRVLNRIQLKVLIALRRDKKIP